MSKVAILIAIAGLFLAGMAGTVYLSLRSPEVQVPEVTGKNIVDAEQILSDAGLNVRRRASRYSAEVSPTPCLINAARGRAVKAGQTIAVVISRAEAKRRESRSGSEQTKRRKKIIRKLRQSKTSHPPPPQQRHENNRT